MKQQKFFGIILVFCVLLTLAGCASSSAFDGSSAKKADSYHLDFSFENVNTTYPEHTHIEPCVISGVRFFEIISVKR